MSQKMYRYKIKYRTKNGTVRVATVNAPNQFAASQAVKKRFG